MASNNSASSAYAAASLQRTLGRIPGYAPKKKEDMLKGEKEARKKAAKEAALSLISDPPQNLHSLKLSISSKYRILFLKNSEIMKYVPASHSSIRARLLKSPTRTLSGVSPIALMPPPSSCCGECIYCPKSEACDEIAMTKQLAGKARSAAGRAKKLRTT